MTDDNSFVQKLIAESKKLTEANIRKCEHERLLKELTAFKNLSTVGKEDSSAMSDKVFQILAKVVPGVHRFGENSCSEILIIAVENISKCFHFNPSYWQFVIDIGNGKKVSSWSLENTLDPGKTEKFSISFATDLDNAPLEVKVGLTFSISFQGQSFVKVLQLQKMLIDVLYMLSPARLPREQMFDSITVPSSGSYFPDTDFSEASTELRKFPSVTQFFLKFDSVMLQYFFDNVLISDSKERFAGIAFKDFISNSMFSLYYQEEEIIVKYNLETGTMSFKCSNPKLLCALKSAIFTRLMLIKNIKVISPDDSVCEKLYSLKLRVEDIARPTQEGPADARDLMDSYLELRDISEAVQFILLNDVE